MKEILDADWGMHLLEIEITYRCNLNCLHCYNRYEKIQDMPLEEIIKIIEYANKRSLQKFIISGGEACLHPNFKELCEYIINNKSRLNNIKKFGIQTNGYLHTIEDKYLKAFDIVHISYDLENNSIRKINKNQLATFSQKLQSLNIFVYYFVTVNNENMNKIDEIVQDANGQNVPVAFNVCLGNNKNLEFLMQKNDLMNVIKKLLELEKLGKIRPFKHPYASLLKGNKTDTYIGIKGGCTAGIGSCVIKADGDVIPCPFLRISAGNIYKQTLQQIWNDSPLLMKLRDRESYDKCGKCKFLSYCGGCRKSALETSGKIDGADKGCFFDILQN